MAAAGAAAATAGALLPAPPPGPPRPAARRSTATLPAATAPDRRLSASEIAVRYDLARSTGRLDLSDCGLTEVPAEVLKIAGLADLSLAGNALTSVPPSLGELPLARLQLAGNELVSLPDSLSRLTDLEGLWVHGNALTSLPPGIGCLTALRALSAAGNALGALPPGFGDLGSVEDVALGGNRLASLPDTLAGLTALRKLALHGNRLASLPPSLGALGALASLSLQGNALRALPGGGALAGLTSLEALNLADNDLEEVPAAVAGLPRLKVLTLYGNRLTRLPWVGGPQPPQAPPAPSPSPSLASVWLEGNPLPAGDLVAALAAPAGPVLGLDGDQAGRLAGAAAAAGGPTGPPPASSNAGRVRPAVRTAAAPGYWKLDVGPPGAPGAGTDPSSPVLDAAGRPASGGRALIIAFGSAPGEPNWGGLLGRIRAASSPPAASPSSPDPALAAFDVLYCVDPWRSWYDGKDEERGRGGEREREGEGESGRGGEGRERERRKAVSLSSPFPFPTGGGPSFDTWAAHLASAAAPYDGRVLLLGDSMGASAALLFAGAAAASPAATVLAFCPQLDLATSAIRPSGVPGDAAATAAWRDKLRERALAGVATAVASGARVGVHVGSWLHDVDQAAWLGANPASSSSSDEPSTEGSGGEQLPLTVSGTGATVKVWAVHSHRLAAALDARGELLPLVRGAIAGVMGLRSGDVRVANLL